MANRIHPTALIDPRAQLGDDNDIGPFCLIGPQVILGDGNRLEAYVSVGTPAEHRDHFRAEPGAVKIGSHNVIREFVTINGGTTGTTEMGSHCVLLRGSHIGHDAVVRDRANLSCNVLVGGHTIVGEGANLGLGSVIHQRRVVGAYAMIGMNSTVTRNTVPFLIAFGTPTRLQRVNRVGLQRAGVLDSDLILFENWFQALDDENNPPPALPHLFARFLTAYLRDCQSVAAASRAVAA